MGRVGRAALLCALTVVGLAVSAQARAADPAVWIGSPIDGRWTDSRYCSGAKYPSGSCSLPSVHHTAYLGTKAWATDLQVSSGSGVYLYAAPKTTSLNSRIGAKVESVAPSCSTGVVSQGGYRVIVGIYLDKKRRIGQMAYTHINPVSGLSGKWVNRWGTKLGTVGSYSGTNTGCWTGVHLHIEMASTSGYACFNKGWKASSIPSQSSAMKRSNFIGFIGGAYAGPRKACP